MSQIVSEKDITLGAWGNITLIRRESGVCVLHFNTPGGANILSYEVMKNFDEAVNFVKRDSETKALVFSSPKPDMFIAGADIREISKLDSIEAARHLVDYGQELFGRIVELPQPTVAAINGICLGGGLEITLCCDRRIASYGKATLFGLPEVTLGLVPGLGGTQKLLRVIGLKPTIDMLLTGAPIEIPEALELGLIDKVVEHDKLLDEAEKMALELVNSKTFDRQAEWNSREKRIEEKDGGLEKRKSLLKISNRAIHIKTKGFYPAPKKALEVIGKGLEEGLEAGMTYEAEAFAELASSTIARNLINVYFTREMATQTALRAIDKYGEVKELGIIGSGTMGTALAELALEKNINLTVRGSSLEKSEAHAERLRKRGSDSKNGKAPTITAALTDDDFHNSQFIVEAITEDVDAKNKFVFEISRAIAPDCVIASNTSSFPISHLAQMSNKPERVVGLHFFNPVDRMPLVEVITHERTNADVLKRAIAFVGQLGKVPVVIKDSPGFLVNRLFVSFFFEATLLAEEGPINWIDEAAVNFGMPMGPFALLDELGWKLTMGVGDIVHRKFGERLKPPSGMHTGMYKLIDEIGDDKAKFYLVDDSGKRHAFDESTILKLPTKLSTEKPSEVDQKKICERLFLLMVDEATRCLEEKVVRKARDVDLAVIIGAGFPAFRGGLLRYADELGIDYVVTRLEEMYAQTGSRRTVCKMLKNMQEVGRRYYGLGSGD